MSENCTHDCSSCGMDCPSRQDPQSFLEKTNDLSHVKKVIGVVLSLIHISEPTRH